MHACIYFVIFPQIFTKSYVVTTWLNCLAEAIPTNGHSNKWSQNRYQLINEKVLNSQRNRISACSSERGGSNVQNAMLSFLSQPLCCDYSFLSSRVETTCHNKRFWNNKIIL